MEFTELTNVMIVDDDPDQLLGIETILQSLNLNIVRASSGKEALGYLRGMDFAVILLDVKMPMMNGFDTAEKIRARKRSEFTPLIFITSYHADEVEISRGYKMGAVDYIFSPVIPDILRTKVMVFVNLYRMTMELNLQKKGLETRLMEYETVLTGQGRIYQSHDIGWRDVEENDDPSDGKNSVNILIVDDNLTNLFIMETILHDLDVNIFKAGSGLEALRQVLGRQFAVILLDINMPGMNGFETAELIRERKSSRDTPLIFVTSYHKDELDLMRGYSLGALDYLIKPISPALLKVKVSVFINLFKLSNDYKMQTKNLLVFVEQLKIEIDARKHAYDVIDEQRELNDEYLDIAGVIILSVDVDENVNLINRKGCAVIGCEKNEIVGKNWFDHFIPRSSINTAREVHMRIMSEGTDSIGQNENQILTQNGEERTILWHHAAIRGKNGSVVGVLSSGEDITDQRNAEEKILRMAYYDMLTGLPNRTLLEDRLKIAIAQANRSGKIVALFFLDVDNFKVVNDTMGHLTGDRLLIGIGNTLRLSMREGDTVARIGGDEFVVLLSQIDNADDAVGKATKINKLFRRFWTLNGHEVYITVSIGISLYPGDGLNGASLLQYADSAMYKAKNSGRDTFWLYDQRLSDELTSRLKLERNLRYAIIQEEFELFFLPVLDSGDGTICVTEALIRWNHPEKGVVLPGYFIPLAEETGLVLQIDDWVLLQACMQKKKWEEDGYAPFRIAINMSARQFIGGNLVGNIRAVLEKTGLDPSQLELEITESALIGNYQHALAIIKELNVIGINIVLDDFGTGYSSLTYLIEFPISSLKLDRSFINDLINDRKKLAISEAIITLAHKMGLVVTAEGVETQEQLETLKGMGCDRMQGYLFSKPLPLAEIECYLKKGESA